MIIMRYHDFQISIVQISKAFAPLKISPKMTRLGVGALVVVAIIAAELPDWTNFMDGTSMISQLYSFKWISLQWTIETEYSCDNERNDDNTKRNANLLGALGPCAWPMAANGHVNMQCLVCNSCVLRNIVSISYHIHIYIYVLYIYAYLSFLTRDGPVVPMWWD